MRQKWLEISSQSLITPAAEKLWLEATKAKFQQSHCFVIEDNFKGKNSYVLLRLSILSILSTWTTKMKKDWQEALIQVQQKISRQVKLKGSQTLEFVWTARFPLQHLKMCLCSR